MCFIYIGELWAHTTSLTPQLLIEAHVPCQESQRSCTCICVLRVSTVSPSTIFLLDFGRYYHTFSVCLHSLSVLHTHFTFLPLFIEVSAPRQKHEWWCICVLGLSTLHLFLRCSDWTLEPVPTVLSFSSSFYPREFAIPNTSKLVMLPWLLCI